MSESNVEARRYVDDLAFQLRLRDVPGERVGQILAEVQSHLDDSGESPADAFGPPAEYAKTLAAAVPAPKPNLAIIVAICGSLGSFGGFLILNGVFGLLGWEAPLFGLPAWVWIVVGVACLAGLFIYARSLNDPIIDPRSGREFKLPRR